MPLFVFAQRLGDLYAAFTVIWVKFENLFQVVIHRWWIAQTLIQNYQFEMDLPVGNT